MGLALVKKLAALIGVKMQIASKLGRETVVMFTLTKSSLIKLPEFANETKEEKKRLATLPLGPACWLFRRRLMRKRVCSLAYKQTYRDTLHIKGFPNSID